MQRSRLCLICSSNCKGTSADLTKLRENPKFRDFLTVLGDENEDELNTSLVNLLGRDNSGYGVCEKCKRLILEAMDWRGRVLEVECMVVHLQTELLEELRNLEECLGEFGGKLRKIREGVKMEVVQLTFDEDADGGDQAEEDHHMEGMKEEHTSILRGMGNKLNRVVSGLDKFQDNLNNKIDDKRIERRLERKPLKSTRVINSDMESDDFNINHDNSLDNAEDSDWSVGKIKKRIKRRLKPSKRIKSAEFIDSEMDSDSSDGDGDGGVNVINQDNPIDTTPDNPVSNLDGDASNDNDDNGSSDWSPSSTDDTDAGTIPISTNQKKDVSPSTNKYRGRKCGKFKFRNQVIRLILNRAKRVESQDPSCTSVDLKYPINYDPTLDKITIGQTTEILIIKDKCQVNHLKCTLCDFETPNFSKTRRPTSSTVESILDHVITKHFDGYVCEFCGKVGSTRRKFLEHLIVHKKPEKFICGICERPCQTKDSIKAHRFTHFNEEEKMREMENGRAPWYRKEVKGKGQGGRNFICATCGKSFGRIGNLKKHERTHGNDGNVVICPKCGKSVGEAWYRKYHSVYKCPLEDGGKGEVKCDECGKKFVGLIILRKHLKRMHSKEAGERSWICDKCGKGYKSRDDLKTHEKVHAEVMEWRCDECGREFNQKKNYKRHKCVR